MLNQTLKLGSVGLLLVCLLLTMWSARYRYVNDGYMNLTVRIHRVTGTADILTLEGWKPLNNEGDNSASALKKSMDDLTPRERALHRLEEARRNLLLQDQTSN